MEEKQEKLIDVAINKILKIKGVNSAYFIDKNYQIIKSQDTGNNYLEQVIRMIKSEPSLNSIGKNYYSKPFHTFTFLNENGLIIISHLAQPENIYLIIIAGEEEAVDLLGLLKICKETRLDFQNIQKSAI